MRMQIELRSYLLFLITSLVFTSSVWAGDLHPWGEWKDYVQLDSVNSVNQHPVSFSAEQLTRLLGQFYKLEGKKEPAPYFSQDEINRLATKLVPLFAKAKSGDDIEFGTSFSESGSFLIPRKLNAGRLFVENGQLNIIIGMCAAEQDLAYQQLNNQYRELDHGNRMKPADKLRCELLAGNAAERVNNRPDWLRLNINLALTSNAVLVFPSARKLTFGTSISTDAVPTSAPAQSTAMSAKAPGSTTQLPDSEERLQTLRQLHDKGLITDAEYEQKRAEVIKGL
jgi:hypothetical protein